MAMRVYELQELANTAIGREVEYDDTILMPEKVSNLGCEGCYFVGKNECAFVPCSANERMDEENCVYIEVKP